MHWQIKGLVQKILSHTPSGMLINTYLQQKLGGLRNFNSTVRSKIVDDWAVFMQHTNELQILIPDKRLMEIGTGWFPVFPLCYYLSGATSCITYDLNRHLDTKMTKQMLKIIGNYTNIIASSSGLSIDNITERYERVCKLTDIDKLFNYTNIYYNAPCDATKTNIESDSIDIVFSNSVLEHVPLQIIIELINESKRVLKKGGIMMHSVNCGDHYAYFDKKITSNNYLKYTDEQWEKWNNELLYQNRLRPSDFIDLVEQQGFDLVLIKQKPSLPLLDKFNYRDVADKFKKYSIEQLCTTSVDFVAMKR